MSTRDLEVLQAAPDLGPAAHGWDDQRWTLARICKVVHDLFKVEYSVPGMCLLLHRIGWSVQAHPPDGRPSGTTRRSRRGGGRRGRR